MKKIFLTGLTVITFSLCQFLNAQTDDNSGQKTVSVFHQTFDKVSNFFNSSPKEFIGTWNYKGTACKFETENLLKKAGGAIVATQVEKQFDEYCNKLGIKENGNCYFTFNEDSTYSAKLGLIKISGKYSYDYQTNELVLSYLRGIGKLKAFPIRSGNRMKLMFDADGFLKLMKTLSTFTKDNSIEILAAMDDMYDGMLLGFDLNKPKEK